MFIQIFDGPYMNINHIRSIAVIDLKDNEKEDLKGKFAVSISTTIDKNDLVKIFATEAEANKIAHQLVNTFNLLSKN